MNNSHRLRPGATIIGPVTPGLLEPGERLFGRFSVADCKPVCTNQVLTDVT